MPEYHLTVYMLVTADDAYEANDKIVDALLKTNTVKDLLKEKGVTFCEIDVSETVEVEDLD